MPNDLIIGNIRCQQLGDDILRIEVKTPNGFLDENTFFIPSRNEIKVKQIEKDEDEDYIYISFKPYIIKVPRDAKSLNGLIVFNNGSKVYEYDSKLKNTGELPSMFETPVIFPLLDSPRIVMDGLNGIKTLEENALDLYLLKTDGDPYKLRRLYVELTGRTPLLRRGALGVWNSRYYAYTQKEAMDMILEYEKRDIPLDNIVIDTDWRKSKGVNGIGYDINTDLFPDMEGFLSFAHEHNVEVMFNDHPEPVPNASSMLDPKELSFRKEKLQNLLSIGLDTWWYDRNWVARLKSPTPSINPETFGSYLFTEITKDYHSKHLTDGKKLRDDVMSNINDIANGDYNGIKDSAFHRYPFAWSGDISSMEDSLSNEVANMIHSSENLITYYNSDLGGHTGNPDKELYLKWMMYGCFSPIFRPHCCNAVTRYREPWNYDEETINIFREMVKCRYRLLPYIYTNAYLSYSEGKPLINNYSEHIKDDLKGTNNEYLFGEDILVSPIDEIKILPLEHSHYSSKVHVKYFHGIELSGEPILEKDYEDISFQMDDTSNFDNGVPKFNFSMSIDCSLKFDKTTDLYIANDDGARVFINDKLVFDDWNRHGASKVKIIILEGEQEYKLHIDYFQDGGDAKLALYESSYERKNKEREIILPRGEWIDLFNGKKYKGKTSVFMSDKLGSIPLFIRSGSILPLTEEKQTTKEMDFTNLVLDCYLNKDERERFSFYDDDGASDEYLRGGLSYTEGTCHFDKDINGFIIHLNESKGKIKNKRNLKFRIHLDSRRINKIIDNGKEIEWNINKKNSNAPLFAIKGGARDSDVIEFETLKLDSEAKTIEALLKD